MRYFIYCRKSSEAEDRQVLSIESQLQALNRAFESRPDIEIAGIYEEAFSAKAPGRRRFQDMLARIEKGEAAGIVAWAPDRLARNSIDGGQIIFLLDRGVIKDLKFATYTFENNSQGKFMLQIMFGQSKYYSDALSENVKRGNRTKIERGWRPNLAPLGYLNDPVTKTIVKDPVHFPLLRKMFELMLTGAFAPSQIAVMARDEWGFRTPKRRKIGGGPLAMSSIYKILGNPFYAGIIVWDKQTYPGKHPPVVTVEEFRRVRDLLRRPGRPRPQKHRFAYTGMIRCGSCGMFVTAEHKINRYRQHYIYYHCSKRQIGPRCQEPSVQLGQLEAQIAGFLKTLAIDEDLERWILEQLASNADDLKQQERARRVSVEAALRETAAQLQELTGLRLRNLLTDDEFVARRQELQLERLRLEEGLQQDSDFDRFEPLKEVFSFSNRAAEWFSRANDQEKRLIVETVGSNLTLSGKILNIEAAEPFFTDYVLPVPPRQLGDVDVVRMFAKRDTVQLLKLAKKVSVLMDNKRGRDILDTIRKLRDRFEPAAPVVGKKGRRAA